MSIRYWICGNVGYMCIYVHTYIATLYAHTSECTYDAGSQCRTCLCSRYVAEICSCKGSHLPVDVHGKRDLAPRRSSDRRTVLEVSQHTHKTSYPHGISRSSIYFPSTKCTKNTHRQGKHNLPSQRPYNSTNHYSSLPFPIPYHN